MLQALIHKKLKDSFADPCFKASEDSLTSTIFGLMQYLPDDNICGLLKGACGGLSVLPEYMGDIIEFHFWDKWSAKGTRNSKIVEPDVWIETTNYDIIIEAKKYDEWQMQYSTQWKNEIRALLNERDEDKEILFIAIGGNSSLYDSCCTVKNVDYPIHTASWFNLLLTVLRLKEQCFDNAQRRIYEDMVKGFEIHNIFHVDWLESLKPTWIGEMSRFNINSTMTFDNKSLFSQLYNSTHSLRKVDYSLWQTKKK